MIDWPSNPTLNQIYNSPNGDEWRWNGYAWDFIGPGYSIGPTGATGDTGATGSTGSGGNTFLNAYTVYVDPNGDNLTGEFGNINKPFETPGGALYAAIEFMSNNPGPWAIPTGYQQEYDYTPDPLIQVLLYDIRRINIIVFAGYYTPANESLGFLGSRFPLMYNFIDWEFMPGSILLNYGWSDSSNIIDGELPSPMPVQCNVSGKGTFIETNSVIEKVSLVSIYLSNSKSVLNFTGHCSNYSGYIDNGTLNYKMWRTFFLPGGFGERFRILFGITNGYLNYKTEELRSIGAQTSDDFYSIYSPFYSEGGKVDMEIGRYTSINIDTNSVSYADFPSTTSEGGLTIGVSPSLGDWIWNVYDYSLEDFAPPIINYMYQIDPAIPSEFNLKLDYAKIGNYALYVEGGNFNFTPGTIEIRSVGTPGEGTTHAGYLGFIGGPYEEGTDTNFRMIGGRIITKDPNVPFLTTFYTETLEIYGGPNLYIKDTHFIYDPVVANNNYTYSFAIYTSIGDPRKGNLILDGTRHYKPYESPGISDIGIFLTDAPNPLEVFDIKIYDDCFSNFQEGSLYINNLIPGTSIIVDANVELI